MSDRHERELVNLARDEGYGAMRTPSSGRGNSDSLSDLMLYSESCGVLAIEHKSSSVDNVVFDSDVDILPLLEFSERWDATPILCFRFAYDTTHYCIEVGSEQYENLLTRTGNIRPKEDDSSNYRDIMELLEKESAPLVV